MLHTVVAAKDPKSLSEGNAAIEETLATAMHACRCACSESLGFESPGALAFGRDMFLDIPLMADILAIQNNRQLLVENGCFKQTPSGLNMTVQLVISFGSEITLAFRTSSSQRCWDPIRLNVCTLTEL